MLEVTYPRPGGTAALHSLALEVLVLFFRIPAQVEEPAADRVRQVARGIEETFTNAGLWTPRRRGRRCHAATSARSFVQPWLRVYTRFPPPSGCGTAELRRRGGQSVAGVVFTGRCGDVSQFYRHFRARYGVPPKAWSMNGRGI